MQKYYFSALNQEDKPLRGALEASDEARARVILGEAGLAVLDLELYNPEKHSPELGQLYEFSGENASGKLIRGTLVAEDDFSAYTRLRSDYGLKPKSLFLASTPISEREGLESALIVLKERFEETAPKTHEKIDDKALIQKALEFQKKEQGILFEQFKDLIEKLESAFEESDPFLNPEQKRSIQGKLDQLDRIKHSNNLEHLRATLQELLESFLVPDLFLTLSEIDSDLKESYESSRNRLELCVQEFRRSLEASNRKGVEVLLSLAPEKISKKLGLSEIINFVFQTIYLTLFIFVVLFLIFICFSGIFALMGFESFLKTFQALFFSFSAWYVFGFCVLGFLFWGIDFEYPWKSLWKKYLTDSLVFLLLLAIYTANSATLYFWTY